MKVLWALIFAAGSATPAFSQVAAGAQEARMHVQNSFDLIVHAAYAQTAPLFGPNGERAWAGKHWDPQFLHPQPGRDEEGAVFTVRHGPLNAVWVNTLLDTRGRHFQYVYFLSDLMVTVIDVRFKVIASTSTQVTVTYTRTALTAEGDAHVAAMSEGDRKAGPEWQQAIDAYLAGREPGGKP
ncbi:MAG: hypothetical protein WB608_14340 [Terracidiphilus sp.]